MNGRAKTGLKDGFGRGEDDLGSGVSSATSERLQACQ